MFAAVALFVILLLGLLYIAFIRFGDPPPPSEAAPAVWAPSPPPGASAAAELLAIGRSEAVPAMGGAGA